MNNVVIRKASPADAEKILDIYAPYITDTAITYEIVIPELAEFRSRIANTLTRFPYIVAERGAEILGYAYLGRFVGREAYDWSAETSIYLRRDLHKQGLGKRLYTAIEDIARKMHITNLEACIAEPADDIGDQYLDTNSRDFHAHLGYRYVGRFMKCAYKFGNWYDMIWMEKCIGDHPDKPEPFIPFPEVYPEIGQDRKS